MIHVFLGLITNAEDGTVGRVPVVRRRIAEILLRSGVRADSHTGRRLLAALRTLPRDELLEAPTTDLLRLAQLVVDRAEHRTVGVFARIHLNRDFVSVLVYFPADRFGPETRKRVCAVINRYWPGELIGRDDRIVELNLARMQLLIAVRARFAAGLARAAHRRGRGRQGHPTVERRLRRPADRDGRRGTGRDTCGATYDDALPEAYKEDFDAATAVRDLVRLDGCRPTTAWPSSSTRRGTTTAPTSGSRCSAPASRSRWLGRCRSSPRWGSRCSTSGPTRSRWPTPLPCGSTTSGCDCPPVRTSTTSGHAT